MTWSMACMEKLKVMNSQMGLRPAWRRRDGVRAAACEKRWGNVALLYTDKCKLENNRHRINKKHDFKLIHIEKDSEKLCCDLT